MGEIGHGPLFWFALGVVLIVLEIITPGVFFLFFGLGAWFVFLLNFAVPVTPWAQWALFAAVSVISLVLLRRHVIAYLASRKVPKTDSLSEPMVSERYLGQEVDLVTDLGPGRPGTVEFNGTLWQAKCASPLKKGDRARIADLDGLTFQLEPLPGGGAPRQAPPGGAEGPGDPGTAAG
jgi:membrane protein implicated in regulation of membrane protease activity